MKPGYKSSELGSIAALGLLTAANTKLALGISDDVLLALACLVATYVASRGWVKAKAPR
jgi:hypothetical protein